jgi:hypothetical protein
MNARKKIGSFMAAVGMTAGLAPDPFRVSSTASLGRIQRYRAKAERARTIRSAPLNP